MSEQKTLPEKKKKSLLRRLINIILWTVSLLIIAILALLVALNPIAKYTIEKLGPKIAGVNIVLDSIKIDIFDARMELRGMRIDNPAEHGYTSECAIKLGTVNVDLDPRTLSNRKLVIEEITLKDIRVNYETNLIYSNLQAIIDNINRLAALSKKQDPEGDKETRLQIDKFEMENVSLYVIAKGLQSNGAGITLSIEPMSNIGDDPEGVTGFDFAMKIMDAILKNTIKQGGASILNVGNMLGSGTIKGTKAVGGAAIDGTKAVGGAAIDGTKAVGDAAIDGTKAVGGAVKTGIQSLGGLFGGKKETESGKTETKSEPAKKK